MQLPHEEVVKNEENGDDWDLDGLVPVAEVVGSGPRQKILRTTDGLSHRALKKELKDFIVTDPMAKQFWRPITKVPAYEMRLG